MALHLLWLLHPGMQKQKLLEEGHPWMPEFLKRHIFEMAWRKPCLLDGADAL